MPGKRVEVSETPGLDRSQCTHGVDGPLQIWVERERGRVPRVRRGLAGRSIYIFDVDGNRLVFWGAFGPEATEADVEEIDAIVQSFEFTPH